MIKNIVFDLGRVLLNFDPEKYLKSKVAEDKISQVQSAVFMSKEWSMLDEGVITEEEGIARIKERNPDIKDLVDIAFDGWYDMMTPIEETVELLKQFKAQGYKVYYLSNFPHKAFEYVTKKYDFFNLFDGGVVSFKENLLKPDRRIYCTLMKRYDLKPYECLFLDDVPANIDGAQNAGMHGIVFTNVDDTLSRIKDYGVLAAVDTVSGNI